LKGGVGWSVRQLSGSSKPPGLSAGLKKKGGKTPVKRGEGAGDRREEGETDPEGRLLKEKKGGKAIQKKFRISRFWGLVGGGGPRLNS